MALPNEQSSCWSDLMKNKTKFSKNTEWPRIDGFGKDRLPSAIDGQASDAIASCSQQMACLQMDAETRARYDKDYETRSREQILTERKSRKIAQKNEAVRKRYEEQVAQIRAPKCEKVKVVDRSRADQILNGIEMEHANGGGNRILRKNNKKRGVEVNLCDLLDASVTNNTLLYQPCKELSAKGETNKSDAVVRNKGKKTEKPKKKWVSDLKKNILESRDVRRDAGDEKTPLECPVSIEVASKIQFSRKFRPYCNNLISKELCQITENVLRDVFRFQERAYNRNQIKARAQKRFVVGFRETQRQLEIGKIKLLIIAPDLEPSAADGLYSSILPKSSAFSHSHFLSRRHRRFG